MVDEQKIEQPVVSVVHCIDTEGPMEEDVDATFKRIKSKFDIAIEPSLENLSQIQNGIGIPEEIAQDLMRFVSPSRLNYINTWSALEEEISAVTCNEFRESFCDSQGGKYKFSWLLIDVLGYKDNPRRKPLGAHEVWDKYSRLVGGKDSIDSFGWHFHTVPVGRHALEYNTCWTNNDYHEQSLCRRIIERQAFPSTFRAGGVIERNDISFWLEQFIPFDYSSSAHPLDFSGPGVKWDWRGAPLVWGAYHPDWYDYRSPGTMKRSIFRTLEIDGFETAIREDDVRQAFDSATSGFTPVLAVSSHDRRPLRPEIEKVHAMLTHVSKDYPNVSWIFENAEEAARRHLGLKDCGPPTLKVERKGDLFEVYSDQEIFGPAPFLAVEQEGEVFFRDNPTKEGSKNWAYRPDRIDKIKRIGVAACNCSGHAGVAVINL